MIDIIFEQIKELNDELKTLPGIVQVEPQGSVERYDTPDLFYQLVTDIELRAVVEKLFRDGHHARAVEESYKFIDNLVNRYSINTTCSITKRLRYGNYISNDIYCYIFN